MKTLPLSQALAEAWATKAQVAPQLLEGISLTEAQAYQIQQTVYKQQGGTPYWKTGVLSDGSVFSAPVSAQNTQFSPARLNGAQFNALHVEAELAFQFNQAFMAGKEYSETEVMAAIEQVCVCIEILDSRLSHWETADEYWHLADNQMNGGMVLGTGIRDWQGINMTQQSFELFINDQIVASDQGSHPQQDPTQLLHDFVNRSTQQGYSLEAGSWVTTGTWSGYPTANPGDIVRVHFSNIGEALLVL